MKVISSLKHWGYSFHLSGDIIPKAHSTNDITESTFGNDFVRWNGDSVLTQSSNLLQADVATTLPYHFVAQRLEEFN